MAVTEADIDAFGQFAKERLGVADNVSLEQLLLQWEAAKESEAVAADIRQGLSDIEAGKGRPSADVFAEIRTRLGRGE